MRKYQQKKIEKLIKALEEKEELLDNKCEKISDINLNLDENIDEYLET